MRRLAFLLLALAAACASQRPFSNTLPSPDALAREVLSAITRSDESALHSLAITEEEFRLQVWPELPAARPERNVPVSYVWGELNQKSEASLRAVLARHRGRRFELEGVRFDGATTDHAGYRIHRKAVFLVRDADGASELRVCGAMLEGDGQWKVFSYAVDD